MTVCKNFAMPSERWQVLDYNTVVHAVGDSQGEIILRTIIDYWQNTKEY